MYTGKNMITQLMEFLPWTSFTRIVNRYNGDYKVRTLRCTEHYRVMAFTQLRGSLEFSREPLFQFVDLLYR